MMNMLLLMAMGKVTIVMMMAMMFGSATRLKCCWAWEASHQLLVSIVNINFVERKKYTTPDALHVGAMSPQPLKKCRINFLCTHIFQQQQNLLVLSGKQRRSTVNFCMPAEICFCIWNNHDQWSPFSPIGNPISSHTSGIQTSGNQNGWIFRNFWKIHLFWYPDPSLNVCDFHNTRCLFVGLLLECSSWSS